MRFIHQLHHHPVPVHRMVRSVAFLLSSSVILLSACGESTIPPEKPLTYRVIEGACGWVVFVESIGTDSASAFSVVQARKAERFGEGAVTLEAYALEVADERDQVPVPGFYAIRVLSAETGTLLHSVLEVITTGGDLFHLQWCLD